MSGFADVAMIIIVIRMIMKYHPQAHALAGSTAVDLSDRNATHIIALKLAPSLLLVYKLLGPRYLHSTH